jgi:hypothetical protein
MQRERVDVVIRPDYRIAYSQWREITLAHVHIRKWTPTIARQFRRDVDAAHRLLGRSVFAVETQTGSNKKFLLLHDFVECGRAPIEDGYTVPLYVRKVP